MQDKLEDIIKENRAAFDTAEPRHSVWEKIDVELNQEEKVKSIQPQMWFWKAAVVVLIGAVGFLLVDRFSTPDHVEIAEVSASDQFAELETYYTSLITEKKVKIDAETSADEFFTFLETDIEEIDAIYEEMKKTFEDGHETPEMLDALVRLLRQKLHLLSSQLEVINDLKAKESGVDLGPDVSSL